MNQFLSRAVLCFIFSAVISSSGPWAQGVPPTAANNASVVATPVTTRPSAVASVLTAVPAATPVVTLMATPIATTANVSANNQLATLSEVVITANRVNIPVQDVTSSSTVITAKDLDQKQAGTVLDAIQGVPGVDINQTGQPGETSSVYIRGTNPEHTLVLMDGIPLNDPIGTESSYPYLDGLSLDNVKQIEVIRGPQSTLWGSNAIGGVINIVPQSGPSPLGGSVLVEGGSYGTSHEAVGAHGGDNGGYFNIDASHYNTAGFPALESQYGGTVNNGDDNNTASLRLGSNLASNLEEKVSVRYSQSNTSIDADNENFVLEDDPNYFALQKQFMAASHTDWKLLDGSWEQILTASFADDNRLYNGVSNSYNTYFEQGNFDGQTAQINWQNNVRLAKEETVVAGIQGQQQWAIANDTSGYSDVSGSVFTSSVPGTTVQTASAFIESQTSIEDNFFFNLGGRWDDHSQYGVHTTYQAGLAYVVPDLNTKFKANYGTGFLAPSLYQLFAPTYGNSNLLPETSVGYDIGFEQPIGGKDLTVGASYFDNDLTNLIQFVNTYSNVGQARSYGLESFIEFKGVKNFDLKGNYTYDNAQDLIANAPLLRRPQNKASGDVDYQLDAAGLGASLIYVGNSYDVNYVTGFGNTVQLASYFLVNLRVSYQVNSQVKLFARVDNLFNQYYEETFGYTTPGLSAYGGTKISF
jgi:vitamin B12 transporter